MLPKKLNGKTVDVLTIMWFGKHNGKSFKEICETDTAWINWAYWKEHIFDMTDEAFQCYEDNYNIKTISLGTGSGVDDFMENGIGYNSMQ